MSWTQSEYKHGSWFIFGEYTNEPDDYVDVQSEPEGKCIISHIKREEAVDIIKRHQAMLDELDGQTSSSPTNL